MITSDITITIIEEEEKAKELLEFCFRLCTNKAKTSYPIHRTKKEMEEYVKFHDSLCGEMYWNGTRIKKHPDHFKIYIYREHGIIQASLFLTVYDKNRKAEIVGCLVSKEVKEKEIRQLLVDTAMADIYETYKEMDEVVYFVEEGEDVELETAENAGFQTEYRYRCYQTRL